MTVARSIAHPSHPSTSSGSAARSVNAARAVLVAAITALVLALLGPAAHLWSGSVESYPDAPPQWTD